MNNFKPLVDLVVVQRVMPAEQTKSGIILQYEDKPIKNEAIVLYCGPKCVEVKPGMTVLIDAAQPMKGLTIGAKEGLEIVHESHLLAIVDRD